MEHYRQMRDSEKIRAYALRRARVSYEQIAKILQSESDDGRIFNRATIYRACRAMPNLPIDEPFEWHRLEEYDLPWESSLYLLEIWAKHIDSWTHSDVAMIQEIYGEDETDYMTSPFTARRARWCWRIHLADPDLDMAGVLSLASAYESRELVHDLLDVPLKLDDLQALLAYKPWIDKERSMAYISAVKERRIPYIKGVSTAAFNLIRTNPSIFFLSIASSTDAETHDEEI